MGIVIIPKRLKMPRKQHKIAAMIILRHGTKYLLLRRAKEPNRDKYVPVGGKLEAHETPRAAAKRECREETGLDLPAEDFQFCGILTETAPVDYNWICYVYLVEIADMVPPYCDEGTLEWIEHDALADVPTPPTDAAIYACVRRGERFVFEAEFDEALNMTRLVREI